MKCLKNFYPFLILGTLFLSVGTHADIFDEDEGNTLDQSSFNALGAELQDMEQNENYSQVYVPKSNPGSPLPTPQENEWNDESKIASSENLEDENSDEIKRKEAAIMRDLEEHAKPLEGIQNSSEETKIEKAPEENKALESKPESGEFKPRARSR